MSRRPENFGSVKAMVATLTISSYPTNGEPLLASEFGLNAIHSVWVSPLTGFTGGWDRTNSKLKCYWSGTASAVFNEVTNATNLGAVDVLVIGR